MKKEKILFLISTLLITILMLLLSFKAPIYEGKINSIKLEDNQIKFYLENINTTFIFENITNFNIKTNQKIKIFGKKESYKGQEIVFVEKIGYA